MIGTHTADLSSYPAAAFRFPATAQWLSARIAVLIPCHNEEASIETVIRSFRQMLPHASIYVCDNNSTDRTAERARAAGARVMTERLQGKGHVLRRMFSDIEADAYIIVDGDNTYEAASVMEMLDALFNDGLDMVTGTRIAEARAAYRPGHRFGNRFLTTVVGSIFGKRVTDLLSGYRIFSRRFVKSFPVLTSGFEIETEFTVHALELDMPLGEIETPYRDRAADSASKLRTYRDGFRIFFTILNLIRDQKPFQFFAALAGAVATLSIGLSVPIFAEFFRTHTVPRFPTAFLSMGLMLLAALMFASGLILDSVSRGRKELKRLTYLSIPRFQPGQAWNDQQAALDTQYLVAAGFPRDTSH